jgi:hypothetical protein
VARAAGGESALSSEIVEKLAALEAMLGRRTEAPPVEVDLRKRDATNLTCDAVGSVKGVFVGTYAKAPALRAEVRLLLLFPGNLTVEARGVVAFQQDEDGDRPAGYGVVFTELAADARELVTRYAQQRDPVLYDVG